MNSRSSRVALAGALIALSILTPAAELPAAEKLGVDVDHVARYLFAPDLVIRHQRRIELTPEQRDELVGEMQAAQAELLPLQVELSGAGERLARILEGPRVEETTVLDLAEQMLALEARVKRRQMTLLVRIKNLLTEDQQRALYRIRRQQRALGGGG